MTGEEVRDARMTMGMTQRQLAEALGLDATNSKDTVRGWEAGRRTVSGPISVAVRMLLEQYLRNPPPPPAPPPPKRPRGRPRKHPLPDANAPKRPRGRPRKDAI